MQLLLPQFQVSSLILSCDKKYDKPLPKVQVRKMKTLLGSCSLNRDAITFNQYFIKLFYCKESISTINKVYESNK